MRFVNKKYLVVIITILVVIEACCVHLMYQSSRNKETILDNVKLVEENNIPEMFAIMLEQSDGTYAESDSSDWPTDMVYNSEMSGCIDTNGNKLDGVLSFDSSTNVASVETSNTSYCYLYFSTIPNLYKLCRDYNNLNDCMTNEYDLGLKKIANITQENIENTGGMRRYQGNSENVTNNYICFGTSSTDECLNDENKYLYRIIGINNDGKLKIIKRLILGSYQWHNTADTTLWAESDLYKGLNGIDGGIYSNLFINNSNYEYLLENSDWYNKIENYNWKYGNVSSYDISSTEMYNMENSWEETVTAKIGLMYIHDYYYNATNNETGCLWGVDLKNCFGWINTYSNYSGYSDIEWFISSNGASAAIIMNAGDIYAKSKNSTFVVRPVFYTITKIKIISGTGTLSNPYIIE